MEENVELAEGLADDHLPLFFLDLFELKRPVFEFPIVAFSFHRLPPGNRSPFVQFPN